MEHPGPNEVESSIDSRGMSASCAPENDGKDCGPIQMQKRVSGGRATDSARIAKFKKELSAPVVDLGKLVII